VLEAAVERHLTRRVKALGGEVRKVAWLGRRHAPDRLVMLAGRHPLVELKRPDVDARDGQAREHKRLRAAGFEVLVLNTKAAVDEWLASVSGANDAEA
jgi:hypothetical protein